MSILLGEQLCYWWPHCITQLCCDKLWWWISHCILSKVDTPNKMSFTATHWDQTQTMWHTWIESRYQTKQVCLCPWFNIILGIAVIQVRKEWQRSMYFHEQDSHDTRARFLSPFQLVQWELYSTIFSENIESLWVSCVNGNNDQASHCLWMTASLALSPRVLHKQSLCNHGHYPLIIAWSNITWFVDSMVKTEAENKSINRLRSQKSPISHPHRQAMGFLLQEFGRKLVKLLRQCPVYEHSKDLHTGPRFSIKMSSYQYRKSHCGDKTILRPSYLHNGISYTGKRTHLYWMGALVSGVTGKACLQGTVVVCCSWKPWACQSYSTGKQQTNATHNWAGKLQTRQIVSKKGMGANRSFWLWTLFDRDNVIIFPSFIFVMTRIYFSIQPSWHLLIMIDRPHHLEAASQWWGSNYQLISTFDSINTTHEPPPLASQC